MIWRTALEALFVVDDHRAFCHVNPPAVDLLGLPAEQILARRLDDFTPVPARPVLDRLWDQLLSEGTLYGEFVVLRGDGSRVLTELRASTNYRPSQHLFAVLEIGPRLPSGSLTGVRRDSLLSERELEVLRLASDGLGTQQIATTLALSPGTIKSHFESAYDKLEVRDRTGAVARALRLGLID